MINSLLILLCGTVTEDMLGHYSEGFMGRVMENIGLISL